ncbi:MAG: hypothetical protein LBO03_07870 [Acidaminococcales bacterium]|nr:hypothetical protein [Acidaminococcales bacterium]
MAVKKLDARSVHIARCPEEHPKTVYSEEVAAKLAEIQRRTAERFKGRYTAEDRIICEKIADSIDRAMENFTITPYEEVMARLTEMQRKTTERFECETAGKVVEKHG